MRIVVPIYFHQEGTITDILAEFFLAKPPLLLPGGGRGGKAQFGGGAGGGPPSIGMLLLFANTLAFVSDRNFCIEGAMGFKSGGFDFIFGDVTEGERFALEIWENDEIGGDILAGLSGAVELGEGMIEGLICILCGRRSLVLVFARLGRGETCSRSCSRDILRLSLCCENKDLGAGVTISTGGYDIASSPRSSGRFSGLGKPMLECRLGNWNST